MNKKHFILPLFLALLFSSCSIIQNTSFEKRKYSNGFYVNTTHSQKQETESKAITKNIPEHSSAGEKTETEKPTVKAEQKQSPQKIVSGIVGASHQKNSIAQKIEKKIIKKVSALKTKYAQKRQMEGIDFDFAVYAIVIILLTALYTAQILSEDPGMPIGVAVLLGLLFSLISILTGQFFFV